MKLRFKFGASRYLTVLLVAAHGAFILVLPLLTLPLWAKLGLASVLLVSLGYYLRRDAWLSAPDSCIGLVLEHDAAILLLRDGSQLRGRIEPDSLVMPLLTVLRLRLSERRSTRSVTILPDGMERESFRQLRVWLKWGRAQEAR